MLFVLDDLLGGGAADCEAGSDAVVLEVGVLPQVGVATLIAGQASASMTPASTSVLRSSARPYRAAVTTGVGLHAGGRAAGTDRVHVGDEYRSGTSRSRARTARPRDALGTHRHRAGHETAVGVRRVSRATWRAT